MNHQPNYFYDKNQVRFNLISTRGKESVNWLFFPGGPGADSSYLLDLVNILNLPGNVWLYEFFAKLKSRGIWLYYSDKSLY
jgi:hypothetical protein